MRKPQLEVICDTGWAGKEGNLVAEVMVWPSKAKSASLSNSRSHVHSSGLDSANSSPGSWQVRVLGASRPVSG